MSDENVAQTIVTLLCEQRDRRGPGASICPTQVARRLAAGAGEPDRWRRHLPEVRRSAIDSMKKGTIAITRKGKPVDPDDFKGIYRLALPPAGPGHSEDV